MKLTLRPNANGVTTVGGKPFYEFIEIASEGCKQPWAIIHVDVFFQRNDVDLYDHLIEGKTVTVELVIVEQAEERGNGE